MVATSDKARILDNNFAELISSSIGFSSEQTAFPATNAVNRFRQKQYRAKGNFTIDSTNSAIPFTVGATSTTAALTAANYNYETLASHISTILNNNSAGGWSCTYDFSGGTFKFKITNNNSVTLNFSQTTNAVWTAIGFMDRTDATRTSFTADEQRNHTNEYLQFDMGYAAGIKAFIALGTLDENFSISSSATVLLKANNINAWDSVPLEINLNADILSTGIYNYIDAETTDYNYRFWRFEIQDMFNPLGPEECVKISHIYLGDYTDFTSKTINRGFQKSIIDPSKRTEAEGGALYFDVKTKYAQFENIGYGIVDKDDRQTLEDVYEDKGMTAPFYFSIDPNLKISNRMDDLTKYVVFNSPPNIQHVVFDKFNFSINFREVI